MKKKLSKIASSINSQEFPFRKIRNISLTVKLNL